MDAAHAARDARLDATPTTTVDGMNRREFLIASGAAALAAACAPNPVPQASAPSTSAATGSTQDHAAAAAGTTTSQGANGAPASTGSPSVPSSASGGPATFVQHGPRDRKQIALTFHTNGDLALTNQLLGEAESRGVPLTLFVVGSWLDANPSMASKVLQAGHELANHTYTHPSLGQLGPSSVDAEIAKCRDTITRLTGQRVKWFRPSGIDVPTGLILAEAAKTGYATVVGYDVDPLDYQDPGAAAILSRVKTRMAPGSIVSLHTGHAGTVAALPAILDALNVAGLKPVTVSTLLT